MKSLLDFVLEMVVSKASHSTPPLAPRTNDLVTHGFHNEGNTCYANSIFSILVRLPQFDHIFKDRKGVAELLFDAKRNPNRSAITEVINYLQKNMDNWVIRKQSDPKEFWGNFFNLLKKENPEKGFKELEVIYEKRASCQKCTHVFTDEEADNHDLYQEPHCEMLIGDKGGKLSEFLPERIIGGTESGPASKLYVCPVCSEKAGRRQFSLYNRVYWIAYYPEILVLFNVSGNLQNNVTTPLEIHLPAPYCDYPYPDMKEETKSYDLFALVVKSGTFNGGHVWCYVKQPTVDENSAWIKVDDHKTKLMASPFPDIQHDQSVRLWFYVLSDRK